MPSPAENYVRVALSSNHELQSVEDVGGSIRVTVDFRFINKRIYDRLAQIDGALQQRFGTRLSIIPVENQWGYDLDKSYTPGVGGRRVWMIQGTPDGQG